MLGPVVELRTDSSVLVERIEGSLGRFLVDDSASDLIEARLGGPHPVLHAGGTLARLDPDAAIAQAFSLIFRDLIDRIGDHLLLHGAALVSGGGAWLLSGPSGSGKTTLALELVGRGLRLLSDDFCPLGIDTGLLLPFHKAPGIRAGEAARLSSQLAGRSNEGPLPPELLGEDALYLEPAPLAGVLLLGARTFDPAAPYAFCVTFVRPPTAAQVRAFAGLDGVGVAEAEDCELVLSVDPRRVAASRLEEVIESEADTILEYGTLASVDHRRSGPKARLAPVDRSAAVLALAREVQNRRRGGALARRLGGDITRLVPIIAESLGNASCWSLGGGTPARRADAVREAIRLG